MDANDVIENLWYEADTIRRAVAAAYEAVSGPSPMPSSLTQVLAYIAANATGGSGCAAGQSCVTDSKLVAIADGLNGSHTATGGDALVDEIIGGLDAVEQMLSVAVPRLIVDEVPEPTVVGRVEQIDAGTRLSGSTIDLPFGGGGSTMLKANPIGDIPSWLSGATGTRATNTYESLVVFADASNDLHGMTLADFASIGWYIASESAASVGLAAWSPSFEDGQ